MSYTVFTVLDENKCFHVDIVTSLLRVILSETLQHFHMTIHRSLLLKGSDHRLFSLFNFILISKNTEITEGELSTAIAKLYMV